MNILITGSSCGIGKAIALKFLKEGHNVIGIDRLMPADEELQYSTFKFYLCDISDKDNLPELSGINIIINNAGSLVESEAISGKMMGAYYITEKYAFHKNIKSVIFIGSNSAHFGIEFPLYGMCNGGILAYTRNVAKRLAQYQATVNSISPGYVNTTLEKHLLEKSLDKEIYKHYLLKHIQEPEEIAELVYYMSVLNKSITGQDILMDCGESIASEFVETEETLEKYYRSNL